MSAVLSRLVSVLLRLFLVAVGVVVGLFAVFAGLVMALGLIVWSLLRGRKPRPVRFRMNPSRPFGGMGARPQPGEIVDIEAREVPEAPPPPLTRDRG